MTKKLKWSEVSLSDKERLAALYNSKADLTDEAEKLGMNLTTLTRNIRYFNEYQALFRQQLVDRIAFPVSPARRYVDFETVRTDDAIIISDIEIPDHNPEYLLLALLTAMQHNIKTLIIAGDLIATDQSGLVSWVATWVESGELNYEDAVALVVMILKEFERWFESIVLIEGNHDDRVARATQGQVHLGMFLTGTSVKYSRYSYLWMETSRGPVKVVHPQNFSGDPLVLGQKLYSVEPRKAHYVVAHCHRRQDGWSADGSYEIHAIGTGRDPDRTKYKATKPATWVVLSV